MDPLARKLLRLKDFTLSRCFLSNIPGPKPSLPIIGTSWIYYPIIGYYVRDKLHEAYMDKYMKYGAVLQEEFVKGKYLVQIYNYRDIELVLRNQGRTPLRPINEAVKHYRMSRKDLYSHIGLVNSQGEEWYQLRKKLTPILMQPSIIVQYLQEQNSICDDLITLLKQDCHSKASGHIESFESYMFHLALESVCIMCLDTRIKAQQKDRSPQVGRLIQAVHQMWQSYQDLYFGLPLWKYFPTAAYKKFATNENHIYQICSSYIDKAKSMLESGLHDPGREASILTSMLTTPDIDPKDVKMTMIDFIAAGIDNTANSILYVLYQLAKNPNVQQRLYDEIMKLTGNSDKVTAEVLQEAEYLKACVKETFRLSPTIPNIVRILEKDIELSGYNVPAGTPICCQTFVACQLENNFENPTEFRPERWLTGKPQSPFLVLPFGWGARMCVGRRFAEQEIYVTVVKIVRNFQIHYDGIMDVQHKFLIIPKLPLRFHLTPRQE